jgi:DNA-binding Lrp family transcriptional regulator
MQKLLKLILEGEKLSTQQLARILSTSEKEVEAELAKLQKEGVFLGWRPILNPDRIDDQQVRAVIEIKIRPEREGGFDRMAMRISRFAEVESCYLMSGGYDLLAIVTGGSLHTVANFVAQKLAAMDGVLSTATHFLLRAYKEQGFELVKSDFDPDKPAVSA